MSTQKLIISTIIRTFRSRNLRPLPDFNEISPPIKIEQIGKLAGEKRNIDEAAVLSVGAAIYD